MRLWTVTESTITELPDFQISWLPNASYDYLTPQIKHRRGGSEVVALEVGAFIGTIPLDNGDVLRIMPQAGEKALWRMLLLSEGLANQMKREFDEFTQLSYTDEGATTWTYLLARSYFEQLRLIEKNSLKSERVLVDKRSSGTRGKVKLLPTFISLAKHEALPVHCRYRERTFNTAEHSVLSAGALRLFDTGAVQTEYKDISIRWASKTTGRLKSQDLLRVIKGLKTQRYTGARAYYIPALLMARLILVEAGISLDDSGLVQSEVLLTNIRTLFEKYIRAVINDSLKDKGFIVEKREDNAKTLFDDGTCGLVPDILISDRSGVRLILDAKYKIDKPISEADYYQMIAYLQTFQIKTGVLILPTLKNSKTQITSHKTQTGLRIYEMRLPLNDWTVTEQNLGEEVLRLLKL
jgi:5-methylcytosine-specific restriction endonuclease McrBC regulatory subunit McrC